MNPLFGQIFTVSAVSWTVSLGIILISTAYYFLRNRGLPPGPTGLPFLGYWPFMNDRNCHLRLNEMKKKYGDIFSFRVTGCLYINLGSLRAVREAHLTKSDNFNERISKFSLLRHVFEEGIGFVYGEPREIVHRLFVKSIKRRLAKSTKTDKVNSLYDSIKSTISEMKTMEGETIDLTKILIQKCNTNLRLILFDEFGVSEEDIRKINDLYQEELSFMTPMNMLLCGNISKYIIFPLMPKYYKAMKCHKLMEELLYKIIADHESSYNKENIRDIIDEYFEERNKRRDEGDPSALYLTDKTLMASLIQFVGDGVLSVASFTALLTKSLIHHPEEQEKVYEEIREIIGLDRQPCIEDRSKLSYFNAFIFESMRTADFFNFFPSLQCTRETSLSGYRIPKGANTLVNFYCIHNDPELYEQPEQFNPSRFIQVDGKKRAELPILFGLGKRACAGENFTLTQVFLFLTTIVQNFRLGLAENSNSSYEQFLNGHFFIRIEPRDQGP